MRCGLSEEGGCHGKDGCLYFQDEEVTLKHDIPRCEEGVEKMAPENKGRL